MARTKRLIVFVVSACLSWTGFVQPVMANELITAEQVVQRQSLDASTLDVRAQLQARLNRADVASALMERGVSSEEASRRVAALSDAEAAMLLAEIDEAPAGASGELIGTLILVLFILVFSDILGFTRIFPFLRPAR
ncbi:PA2779 family protein [Piscinibacter sp. HJYY11]|uniref:PA2779 family protein n=1 Tax=Piscinibacter sp. HJYY11 TaxID=2801333 RepID=UPI00191C9D8F|nr:PA2779 family protein [Piscinibacter sp. HJYY11]MBL0730927.1 PA2779 family protein [Piscinibacter sp. HJYY11]